MIDQLYDRQYRAARASINADIGHSLRALVKAASNAFRILNRIEYSAPWTERRAPTRCR